MSEIIDYWRSLVEMVREANALGAEFRIVGADVDISAPAELPSKLRSRLEKARDSGWLYSFLGAEEPDIEAEEFLAKWQVTPVLVEDRAQVGACIIELLADLESDPDPDAAIGIDIETAPDGWRPPPIKIKKDGGIYAKQPDPELPGLNPHDATIQCLQAYAGGERAFVFRGAALWEALSSLPSLGQLCAHNAVFESAFLKRYGNLEMPVACTLQGGGLLFGVGNRGLNDTAVNVFGTNAAPPKELQQSCWSAPRLSRGQIAYAATDSVLTYHLWPRLRAGLRREGRLAPYELQVGAIPAVVDMQLRGLGIDLEEHARQSDQWARELTEARRQYHELTRKSPPSTPAELREWIVSVKPDAELPGKWPHTGANQLLSTRVKHLKRLIHNGDPTVKLVLQMLAMEKLISNFGPKLVDLVNPATGRLHASYNIAGAKTGRFTCSRPNLQQLPKRRAPEFRRCIVPAAGNSLICCDWSQIELRAAAWLYQDETMTQAFADGKDLHRLTASAILGIPYEAVEPDDPRRDHAKPTNYGAIYGIKARSLAENAFADYGIDLSVADAERHLASFFRTYRGFARAVEEAENCWSRKTVEILGGRVVKAEWEIETNGHISPNQRLNIPIQGAAANLMLRAIRMVHDRLGGLEAWLVASIHDELLVEAAERDAERARAILEEAMIEAFIETFPGAPTRDVAKAGIGNSWRAAKP